MTTNWLCRWLCKADLRDQRRPETKRAQRWLGFRRAGEGVRTLDVHLGKVALYH
jgi:hypothetical protein